MNEGKTSKTGSSAQRRDRRADRRVAAICLSVVAGMVGLSYAAVPLYQMFCQVTGYGGTTQRAEAAPDVVLDRKMLIRFDSHVAKELNWSFKPAARTMEVRLGEPAIAFYEALNNGTQAVVGTASFNVTPEIAGSYFSKIECFCFTEQALKPGEHVDMPLQFFVDPEIVNDLSARGITEITLSYTFFPVEKTAEELAASVHESELQRAAKNGT